MNVATYLKFDDITNALVELKPTRLADPTSDADLGSQRLTVGNSLRPQQPQFQLDTSFNPIHFTLGEALDKLQSASVAPTSGQQTPALGKLKYILIHCVIVVKIFE